MQSSKIGILNFATSMMATALRTGVGISSKPRVVEPEQMLKLFDMEGCPYCRLVREALTELDLDAEIYPCPKGGQRYRAEVIGKGGKAQFPFLQDPNTGIEMYESLGIIEYLFNTYGKQELPLKWQMGQLQTIGSSLVGVARVGRGLSKKPSRAPAKLLQLYSFESSPYARLVREYLCELELPYILRNCGRTELGEWLLPPLRNTFNVHPNSQLKNRRALQEMTGKMSIPYLIDPNTDIAMFESAVIIAYLTETYAE
ncbi:MAG: glutathione S-transferase [Paraglaciecola sp.]|jgi:glutathione S-transferase